MKEEDVEDDERRAKHPGSGISSTVLRLTSGGRLGSRDSANIVGTHVFRVFHPLQEIIPWVNKDKNPKKVGPKMFCLGDTVPLTLFF